MRSLLLLLLLLSGCGEVEEHQRQEPESRIEPSAPPPSERHPLKEGFTQRPPKDTPGLPSPAVPLLNPEELKALREKSLAVSDEERDRAQTELLTLLDELETRPSNAKDEAAGAFLSRIRKKAAEDVGEGRVSYWTVEAFFREFLYPNDESAAESRYRGKLVVLTGSVAPHNMLDLADGFKLIEQTPYVHEPVLLATEFELSFVRCHLARRELQKLRDWQEVHLLGVVQGKTRGDVVLRRCVVL